MGPCPICGEPVALYNGKVIALRKNMLGEGGDFGEKIQSLARIIMEYINSQDGPVDENRLERIIREAEDRVAEDSHGPSEDDPVGDVSPSIRSPVASPITREEIHDFLSIDLHLLAKKDYFEKHFG